VQLVDARVAAELIEDRALGRRPLPLRLQVADIELHADRGPHGLWDPQIVKIEIAREIFTNLDPAHSVAPIVQSGREDTDSKPSRENRDDPATDPALAGSPTEKSHSPA
jgi:hypothetical protein